MFRVLSDVVIALWDSLHVLSLLCAGVRVPDLKLLAPAFEVSGLLSQLFILIYSLMQRGCLEIIDLRLNLFGDQGAQVLAEGLCNRTNPFEIAPRWFACPQP
jgi:hypothetical protein